MEDFLNSSDLPIKKQGGNIKSQFTSFICLLESYKTKFKNLHWAASNDTLHVRIDGFLGELDEFQDELSETGQGILGFQFGPTDIKTTSLSNSNPLDAVTTLKGEVLNFHKLINSNPEYVGMVNSVEGFMTIIGKYIYLFKIAAK